MTRLKRKVAHCGMVVQENGKLSGKVEQAEVEKEVVV